MELARLAELLGTGDAIDSQARPLSSDLMAISHELAHGRYQSPLRYPGAKSSLAPVIARVITSAKQSSVVPEINLLVEPFAGGASASLRMVGEGVVDRILLADADPLVTAFWQTAAEDTERLVDRMYDEWKRFVREGGATAVGRWDYWQSWTPPVNMTARNRRLGAAIKCLFLNRTTFSGILHGKAGPIGGRAQASKYPIGCRWNPEAIAERLRYVGHLYDVGRIVDVWRKDWRQTLDDVPEYYPHLLPSRVVAYLDPPYVEKSSLLYRTSFDPRGGYGGDGLGASRPADDSLHLSLADYLRTKAQFRWLLSYDNHPMLTQSTWLYAHDRMNPSVLDREVLGVRSWRISKRLVTTRYTAAGRVGKRSADELLITTLPPATIPTDSQLRSFDGFDATSL
ncbi:DNA adenine methylase [Streptacidiphilus sp. P02-A3a]|uniref:DNA adenine methylase n=1 Tax=Streptacidiphilus sp. P02-A3a TaxID=2704468 RepID=UPI0015FDE508|nr:DNA adenine methylase [Streptacidiphilus sp. P02-A3a]QMU67116.1 DNA adenine methylase [Streptacidiphilus sp. P02-A3a]